MSSEHVLDAVGHWTASVSGAPVDVWIDRRAGWRDTHFCVSYRRPGRDYILLRGGLTEAEAFATAARLRTALAASWVSALSPNGDHG